MVANRASSGCRKAARPIQTRNKRARAASKPERVSTRCETCWSEAPAHPRMVCGLWTKGRLMQQCQRHAVTEAAGRACTAGGHSDALTYYGPGNTDYTSDVRRILSERR